MNERDTVEQSMEQTSVRNEVVMKRDGYSKSCSISNSCAHYLDPTLHLQDISELRELLSNGRS